MIKLRDYTGFLDSRHTRVHNDAPEWAVERLADELAELFDEACIALCGATMDAVDDDEWFKIEGELPDDRAAAQRLRELGYDPVISGNVTVTHIKDFAVMLTAVARGLVVTDPTELLSMEQRREEGFMEERLREDIERFLVERKRVPTPPSDRRRF